MQVLSIAFRNINILKVHTLGRTVPIQWKILDFENSEIWNNPGKSWIFVLFQEIMENWYFKVKLMEKSWNSAETVSSVRLSFLLSPCMYDVL